MVKLSRFLSAGSLIFSSQWLAPVITGILGVSTIYGVVSVRELIFFAAGAIFWSAFNGRRRYEE
ncbi:MAG: hypothetical protein MJZ68_01540 [archaeon]|nr:hypothetical protein [archaeon]